MLWKGFQRPKRLEFDQETLTPTYGRFSAQPFERGFGTTVGNALRRVLLSSIEGAALTAVKIEGVLHEFSSLPGVVEDTTNIILNMKQVPILMHTDEPKVITIKAESKKRREITSGDIQCDQDIEIIDPGIHIATISDGGKFEAEMVVKQGRGYISADQNFDPELPIGFIPLDSSHSPVTKVSYVVEATRLGQTTDYDSLTMELWTKGTIIPQDALSMGSMLLRDHLNIFLRCDEQVAQEDEEPLKVEDLREEYLDKSVEELELSVRSYNCLKSADITTIRELVLKTEAEMLKTKNFGRKSLNEIKEILMGMGLGLGMDLSAGLPEEE